MNFDVRSFEKKTLTRTIKVYLFQGYYLFY